MTPTSLTLSSALLFCLCFTYCARAQESQADDIVTDRPDVTESSVVIPKGSVQFENGITLTQDHGDESLDFAETLVRVGISSRTELRLTAPEYLVNASAISGPSGLSDFSIGVKQQLGPLRGGFELALITAVSFPTGAASVSSHGFDPFVKLPWSKELGRGWSIGGMQSFFWNTQNNRRNPLWETTFVADKEIAKPLSVFVEYAGDFPRIGGSRQIAHVGVAYKLTPTQQLDCHFGFGLSSAAPQRFFAVGYSLRLDGIL